MDTTALAKCGPLASDCFAMIRAHFYNYWPSCYQMDKDNCKLKANRDVLGRP